MLKTISKISRHVENQVKNFKACWNIVFKMTLQISTRAEIKFSPCITDFNMHYRFQHVLKFSKCFFKMLSTHFKHKNSPMLWSILKTVLKTMSNISKCVENHVENFKACWKPCWKFQSVSKITMTWLLHDPFHQFWNIIAVIKIKSDITNEDHRSLWCYMWLKSCVVLKS